MRKIFFVFFVLLGAALMAGCADETAIAQAQAESEKAKAVQAQAQANEAQAQANQAQAEAMRAQAETEKARIEAEAEAERARVEAQQEQTRMYTFLFAMVLLWSGGLMVLLFAVVLSLLVDRRRGIYPAQLSPQEPVNYLQPGQSLIVWPESERCVLVQNKRGHYVG